MELLTVMAVIGILAALVVPMMASLKTANNITKAAADIASGLEKARAYAIANNTYAWAGFYEEDGSQASTVPAAPGVGRIVLDLVASDDGTCIYNSAAVIAAPTTAAALTPGQLEQIAPLVKISNMHLAVYADGSGAGATFDTRPPIGANPNGARIGNISTSTGTSPPAGSVTTFTYPLAGATQYTFSYAIQFSPRGEARVDNITYPIEPNIEIGIQDTHGDVMDATNKNPVAIQVAGIGGNVIVYRK
jgi:type II secretory pathway pseudopilin PulG